MATPEPLPRRLLVAYHRTRYRAFDLEIRLSRRVPDALFKKFRAHTATFITAWNPRSNRMPEGWNRRMQQRLLERLRRSATFPAEGSLGRWYEAHLLVAGDPRRLRRLARVFRQRAVVVVQRGGTARLALLS